MKLIFMYIISIVFFSCQFATNNSDSSFLEGDFESPKMLSFNSMSETLIEIVFSKEITLNTVSVDLVIEDDLQEVKLRKSESNFELETQIIEGTLVQIYLKTKTELGRLYSVQGQVSDKNGNTLDFLGYITGYNSRIPALIINEVRTETSKLKVEFIELLALSDGNLSGINIFSAHGADKSRYEFPAVDVRKGEYIVLHLRSIEEGIVDEVNAMDESAGTDALPTARDFWKEGNSKLISKTDVLLLEDRKDGKLIDALLLSSESNEAWPKELHETMAKRAFEEGIWSDGWDISQTIVSDFATNTRTISRQSREGMNGKDKWITVATSNATPGKENSSKPHTP
ncbi:MAG: hypothetical protein ACRC5H_08500 [Treponemataceae bacterium]